MNQIVMLDALVIVVSLAVLGSASWSLFVKHKKILGDVFFFGCVTLFFGVGNMLDKLKAIPSEITRFLPFVMLLAIIIYTLLFVSRRTAASKAINNKG